MWNRHEFKQLPGLEQIDHEKIPKIKAVQIIGEARLPVTFENGIKKTYDGGPLLSRPQFHLLASSAFFKAVHVDPVGYGLS